MKRMKVRIADATVTPEGSEPAISQDARDRGSANLGEQRCQQDGVEHRRQAMGEGGQAHCSPAPGGGERLDAHGRYAQESGLGCGDQHRESEHSEKEEEEG